MPVLNASEENAVLLLQLFYIVLSSVLCSFKTRTCSNPSIIEHVLRMAFLLVICTYDFDHVPFNRPFNKPLGGVYIKTSKLTIKAYLTGEECLPQVMFLPHQLHNEFLAAPQV